MMNLYQYLQTKAKKTNNVDLIRKIDQIIIPTNPNCGKPKTPKQVTFVDCKKALNIAIYIDDYKIDDYKKILTHAKYLGFRDTQLNELYEDVLDRTQNNNDDKDLLTHATKESGIKGHLFGLLYRKVIDKNNDDYTFNMTIKTFKTCKKFGLRLKQGSRCR